MIEHTTDRLFWTLASIIVGALILTIGVNTFPKATQNAIHPISGMLKQADTVGKSTTDAANQANQQVSSFTINPSDIHNKQPQKIEPGSTKETAVDMNDLGFEIYTKPNDDSAGIIAGYNGKQGSNVTIPEYIKGHGQVVKIVDINSNAFTNKGLTSVIIPDSVTSIDDETFKDNQLTSVKLPSHLQMLGEEAFANNKLTSIDIPTTLTDASIHTFYGNQIKSVSFHSEISCRVSLSNEIFDYGVQFPNATQYYPGYKEETQYDY